MGEPKSMAKSIMSTRAYLTNRFVVHDKDNDAIGNVTWENK